MIIFFISWCKANISDKEDYSSSNCGLLPLLNIVMTICKYHIFLAHLVTTDFSFSTLLKRIAMIIPPVIVYLKGSICRC